MRFEEPFKKRGPTRKAFDGYSLMPGTSGVKDVTWNPASSGDGRFWKQLSECASWDRVAGFRRAGANQGHQVLLKPVDR